MYESRTKLQTDKWAKQYSGCKGFFYLASQVTFSSSLWVKVESPSLSLRWSFFLVFSSGCSTYHLLLYGEGNDLGRKKKAKSCTISDKNAALVPISEFFLHLYIEQSWFLTLSSPFPKCHLTQVISEREERALWGGTLGRPHLPCWKMPWVSA